MNVKLVMRKVPGMQAFRLYEDSVKTKWLAVFSPYDNRMMQGKWVVRYGNAFRGMFDSREEAFAHIKGKYLERIADILLEK